MAYSMVAPAEDIVAQALFRLFGSNSSDRQSRLPGVLVYRKEERTVEDYRKKLIGSRLLTARTAAFGEVLNK